MQYKYLLPLLAAISSPVFATTNQELQNEIAQLRKQTRALEVHLNMLQKQLNSKKKIPSKTLKKPVQHTKNTAPLSKDAPNYHSSLVSVRVPDDPAKIPEFYPTGLIADGKVVTYIAGTPVIRSPYTGERPAFDGSDYLINISSINRDVRLLLQRRKMYNTYREMGYPVPTSPIVAISGKIEPIGSTSSSYVGSTDGDINLGSSELDVAAVLNEWVEGFIAMAYDDNPPVDGGPRVSNSNISLNSGFVNIGNLNRTPLYLTAGQLFAPYGRYATSMISSPLTMRLARNKTRPVILGYHTQYESGPFAAIYGFKSDTTLGQSGNGGFNLGYKFSRGSFHSEIGGAYVRSIADADGMQLTFANDFENFGGFGSPLRGNEFIRKTPGADAYGIFRYDRYTFTAEWVGATESFRFQDLSYNYSGAKPQAGQLEAGVTFMAFNRPSSAAIGYQWTKDALALGLPKNRISAVFNISIWKDTIESIEYRHDRDYGLYQFANGASPFYRVNTDIYGSGGSSDTLLLQLGVYF